LNDFGSKYVLKQLDKVLNYKSFIEQVKKQFIGGNYPKWLDDLSPAQQSTFMSKLTASLDQSKLGQVVKEVAGRTRLIQAGEKIEKGAEKFKQISTKIIPEKYQTRKAMGLTPILIDKYFEEGTVDPMREISNKRAGQPTIIEPAEKVSKAVQKLLGEEIKSEYLNDDKIGRVMDEMYKMGLNGLFIEIVLSVIKKFQIETKYSHLDSTSFHLDGEYKNEIVKEENEEIIKERPILITKGYSRDHRPDLKQCVLDLIVSNDGDLPLFMRTGDGNESDKAVFGKILVEFKRRINLDSIMVADSALYSQENLKIMEDLNWITRVPLTLKKAKELMVLCVSRINRRLKEYRA
jgi:hypothetical protein